MSGTIYWGDNLPILRSFSDESIDLIYIDPPFNTGKIQRRQTLQTIADKKGARIGFKGKAYRTVVLGETQYSDRFDDFESFIYPRLQEAYRLLKPNGSLFFHIDYREVHYCKIWLDQIFGHSSFINEIIWSYDYGARSKRKWSNKHDTILWFAKNPKRYTFNFDAIDRIEYMAPNLVGEEKAKRGKTPTDVWWHTIVSPNGKEKTGYATQKPLGIINRLVKVHSNEGEVLLDFFAGSGTLGEAAQINNRQWILIDQNPQALAVMKKRLGKYHPQWQTLHKKGSTYEALFAPNG